MIVWSFRASYQTIRLFTHCHNHLMVRQCSSLPTKLNLLCILQFINYISLCTFSLSHSLFQLPVWIFCCCFCLKFYPVIFETPSTHASSSIINDKRKWNKFPLMGNFHLAQRNWGNLLTDLSNACRIAITQGACMLQYSPLLHLTSFCLIRQPTSNAKQTCLEKAPALMWKWAMQLLEAELCKWD